MRFIGDTISYGGLLPANVPRGTFAGEHGKIKTISKKHKHASTAKTPYTGIVRSKAVKQYGS